MQAVPQDQFSGGGRTFEKRVRFVAQEGDNNTVVSCRAEQRDSQGVLIFTTTESSTLQLMPPGFVPYASQCSSPDAEWWCGHELLLYLILVAALLLLVTCCGVCFCCATHRRAKKMKYPPTESHESQQELIGGREGKPIPGGILKQHWEPTFFPPPATSSPAPGAGEQQPQTGEIPHIQLQASSPIPAQEQRVFLESNFDAESGGLDESLLDPARPPSQPSTIGNFYSDEEGEGNLTIEEEIAKRRGILTEYEETMITNRQLEITTIEERLRRIKLNRSMSNVSDTSLLEDEIKKYEARLYSLQDCADINSRDLSYSQVVKEHLSHTPSLNVSRNDVMFSVPANLTSRLLLSESQNVSRTQSPMPIIGSTLPVGSALPAGSLPTLPRGSTLPAGSMPTLPSTARLPAHKPTILSTLPPTPAKKNSDESHREIIEKHLSNSRELLDGIGSDNPPKLPNTQASKQESPKEVTADNSPPGHGVVRTVFEETTTSRKTVTTVEERRTSNMSRKSPTKDESPSPRSGEGSPSRNSGGGSPTAGVGSPSPTSGGRSPTAKSGSASPGSNSEKVQPDEEEEEEEGESFEEIVAKHLGRSVEALDDHAYAYTRRQVSLDGSCFTAEKDFDVIVDPNCSLAPEDVKKAFTDLRDQGRKIDEETFLKTMMAFFPKYNVEENRVKLGKLFDRLDANSDGLISFRQFMLVTIAFSNVPLIDKLTRIFRLIDENDDQELTYGEFQEVVRDILVLKEERKLSTSLVESRFSENTFRHMGMNASGNIILRDFVDACTQQKFILINYIENFRDGFQSS